jgi:hypothetical protein
VGKVRAENWRPGKKMTVKEPLNGGMACRQKVRNTSRRRRWRDTNVANAWLVLNVSNATPHLTERQRGQALCRFDAEFPDLSSP